MNEKRCIVHVDMDAFFASVEQRDDPALRGKAVVVGADPKSGRGRGVVSTCSYEARKFGLHSAMPISIAFRKCPHAVFLPPDMRKYQFVSGQIYAILRSFTPDVEPMSIDEAFLDISGSFHLWGSPGDTCMAIKSRIKEELGLTASLGLAPIKMAAKIASDLKKPDGYVEVKPEELIDFLWPLSVGKIPGVGAKAESALRQRGVLSIGDLAGMELGELTAIFGKSGSDLWNLARGNDNRRVVLDEEIKSISKEVTFEKDSADKELILNTLMGLSEEVSRRMRKEGLKGRTVSFKIRLEGFETFLRSHSFLRPTYFSEEIFREVKALYDDFVLTPSAQKSPGFNPGMNAGVLRGGRRSRLKPNTCCVPAKQSFAGKREEPRTLVRGAPQGRKVRLLGVKVSSLSAASDFPDDLFEADKDRRKESMYKALEKIEDKFGEGTIHKAYKFI